MTTTIEEYADQVEEAYEVAQGNFDRLPRFDFADLSGTTVEDFLAAYDITVEAMNAALALAEDRGQEWDWAAPSSLIDTVENMHRVVNAFDFQWLGDAAQEGKSFRGRDNMEDYVRDHLKESGMVSDNLPWFVLDAIDWQVIVKGYSYEAGIPTAEIAGRRFYVA